MVNSRSYISSKGAASINQARRNIVATKVALQEPTFVLVLSRFDPDIEDNVDVDPQTDVAFKIERKSLGTNEVQDGAKASYLQVTLDKVMPFDVQVRDTAKIEDTVFTITLVLPERSGVIRAIGEADTGGRR